MNKKFSDHTIDMCYLLFISIANENKSVEDIRSNIGWRCWDTAGIVWFSLLYSNGNYG